MIDADAIPRRAARDRTRSAGIGAAAFAAAALIVAAAYAGPAMADATDPVPDEPLSLTVDVEGGAVPTPTASSSPQPSASPYLPGPPGAGGGSNGAVRPVSTGDVTQATIPDASAADDALGDEPVVVAGAIAMSGLTATASPSLAIGNGHVTLDFVIRNTSHTAFDATARFWIDTAFGGVIADIDGIEVTGLQPDETRRVQLRVPETGQHVMLRAHTTLTPPEEVDGVELEPINRDATLFVPPWFSISLAGGLGAVGGVLWWLFRRGGLALVWFGR